jgi:hypothetical protein
MNSEIISYIEKERGSGASDEKIKADLVRAGWQEQDVVAALAGQAIPAELAANAHDIEKAKRQMERFYARQARPGRTLKSQIISTIIFFAVLATFVYWYSHQ